MTAWLPDTSQPPFEGARVATFAAAPTFIAIVRSATPGDIEMARNPRARSARLRAAERTEAPARGASDPLAYGVPQLAALNQFMARA